MVFKNHCIVVLWRKVASALEELISGYLRRRKRWRPEEPEPVKNVTRKVRENNYSNTDELRLSNLRPNVTHTLRLYLLMSAINSKPGHILCNRQAGAVSDGRSGKSANDTYHNGFDDIYYFINHDTFDNNNNNNN